MGNSPRELATMARIADALERIATALEAQATPSPEKAREIAEGALDHLRGDA